MEENNIDFEEWKAARNSIDKFDQYVYDLRKYGFTFITALLTAQAILIPGNISASFNSAYIPTFTKIAVIIVTLVLIIAVALFEKHILIMQRAAAQRALVLERRLNMELTEIISYQFTFNKGNTYKHYIYLLLVIGTLILAYSLPLNPNPIWNFIIVLVLFILTFACFKKIHSGFQFKRAIPNEDWTINKLVCQQGEKVGITVTNFSENIMTLERDENAWIIEKEDPDMTPQEIDKQKIMEEIKVTIKIRGGQSFTWLWDTKNVEEGIYRVIPRDYDQPLHRRIRIRKNYQF